MPSASPDVRLDPHRLASFVCDLVHEAPVDRPTLWWTMGHLDALLARSDRCARRDCDFVALTLVQDRRTRQVRFAPRGGSIVCSCRKVRACRGPFVGHWVLAVRYFCRQSVRRGFVPLPVPSSPFPGRSRLQHRNGHSLPPRPPRRPRLLRRRRPRRTSAERQLFHLAVPQVPRLLLATGPRRRQVHHRQRRGSSIRAENGLICTEGLGRSSIMVLAPGLPTTQPTRSATSGSWPRRGRPTTLPSSEWAPCSWTSAEVG